MIVARFGTIDVNVLTVLQSYNSTSGFMQAFNKVMQANKRQHIYEHITLTRNSSWRRF